MLAQHQHALVRPHLLLPVYYCQCRHKYSSVVMPSLLKAMHLCNTCCADIATVGVRRVH